MVEWEFRPSGVGFPVFGLIPSCVQDRAGINPAPTALSHGSIVGEGFMPSRSTHLNATPYELAGKRIEGFRSLLTAHCSQFTCSSVSGKEENGDFRAGVKTLHVFGNDHISVGAGQYADRPGFPEYR